MKPLGGTEILYTNLLKYVGTKWQSEVNLIPSICNLFLLDQSKINVVWQHLMTDQPAVQDMRGPAFLEQVDHFVYVSHWQLEQFQRTFDLRKTSDHVIKNAIDPIEYVEKPTDRLRLIYTSMPDRGLDVLLDAFERVDRDVELVVYSSNIIYGKAYAETASMASNQLLKRCQHTPNVTYMGYATNKAVRRALQQAHIFAYPSTYKETSCLSAIEAGAAGCKIVTTDYGALPETCKYFAEYTPHTYDREKLVKAYADNLDYAIDSYTPNTPARAQQSAWFNKEYSWASRAEEWSKFFDTRIAK